MNYTGLKCSVCGKVFTADDDVVVCPQCGAPYHRACYEKEGKCIYAERHGTPNAWNAPQPAAAADEKKCPRCGAPNAANALFCAHCGLPLSENAGPRDTPFPNGNAAPRNGMPGQPGSPAGNGQLPPNYGYPGQQPFPFLFDPLGGVSPDEPVENVPAGDLAKYVQENTQYYIPVFADAAHFGKNRFNFAAFLFQGIWMLFRKLYQIGAAIAAVQGCLLVSYLFLMKYSILPLYEKLYAAAGINLGSTTYSITSEQRDALVAEISALPALQQWLAVAPALYLLLSVALMIVCGALANRIYMKRCLSEVRRIHSETSGPADFAVRLQRTGGVNTAVAAVFAVCLTIVYFFLLF